VGCGGGGGGGRVLGGGCFLWWFHLGSDSPPSPSPSLLSPSFYGGISIIPPPHISPGLLSLRTLMTFIVPICQLHGVILLLQPQFFNPLSYLSFLRFSWFVGFLTPHGGRYRENFCFRLGRFFSFPFASPPTPAAFGGFL